MAQDCEKLSPKAQQIFSSMQPYFPPDPWENPQWFEDGRVFTNGWFDLKKSEDRKKLAERYKSTIGYVIESRANQHRKEKGSLKGFRVSTSRPSLLMATIETLLLLGDLDFQIETMDIVDGCE